MMFPIWAVIWDSTKCDIKHGHDGYFRRDDIMVENAAGTFFAKKSDRVSNRDNWCRPA
jgi:hypothetical protein